MFNLSIVFIHVQKLVGWSLTAGVPSVQTNVPSLLMSLRPTQEDLLMWAVRSEAKIKPHIRGTYCTL